MRRKGKTNEIKELAQNADLELKVVVSNKVSLDPNEPVPISFNGNLFHYSANGKYIPFLGADDTFASTLLGARLMSSSHNACISSISQCLIGKGLQVKDNTNPNPDFLEWCKNVNKYKQSLNESLIHVIDGERTFGNQFVEIVTGETLGKKFMKIYPQCITKCRLAAPDKEDDDYEVQQIIVSNKFNRFGNFSYDKNAKKIPIWSDNILDKDKAWLTDDQGYKRTMLFLKNDVSGIPFYGLPASIAGLRYQILEAKAAQYNIDNFDNNMILGGILILKSGMSQEEAQATAREIFMTHIGAGKTGRIAVVASEQGLTDVDFKPFNTSREASYNDSDKRWEEKIIAANEWDSVLAGINRSSTFGNGSQYIRSIWDVKDAVLLNPLRNKLIDKIIKPISYIWAEHFGVDEVKKYEFNLQTNMPFSFMGELDPNTFFQVNEARAKAGQPKDDNKEGVYLSEMGSKQNNLKAATVDIGAAGTGGA